MTKIVVISLLSLCHVLLQIGHPQNPAENARGAPRATVNQQKPLSSSTLEANTTANDIKTADLSNNTESKKPSDWWLIAFTGVLAVVAIFQFTAIIWQVLTSREATEIQLRAYVSVSKIRLDITDPRVPIGLVDFQNFGQTPAYNVRQWVGIIPGDFPLKGEPPRFDQLGTERSESKLEVSNSVMPPKIPQSGIAKLKKPLPFSPVFGAAPLGLTIYVYGAVVYEDIFKKTRHTEFRYFFGGPDRELAVQETESGRRLGLMRADLQGNYSD
jgi:hypothetical protein